MGPQHDSAHDAILAVAPTAMPILFNAVRVAFSTSGKGAAKVL
jgi:hypothetical protein